jgi:hypothetical protein
MPYNLLIVYKSVFEAYFGGRGRRLCDICNFQRKVVCVALWNSAKLGDLRPQSRPFCDVPRLVFITPCIRSLKSTYMQDMFIFGFCCQEEHIYITDSKNSFLFWHFFLTYLGTKLWILHRNPRRIIVQQGKAVGQWRQVGIGNSWQYSSWLFV